MKTKIKKYAINLLLLLFSISLVLILFEIYLRYDSIIIYDEQLGYKLKPNSIKTFNFGVNYTIKINSDGLRDREFGEKDNDTFRILFLGDSFTFGWSNNIENTYVKLLEKKLVSSNLNTNFEVVNAGVFGYGPSQELYMLKNLKKKYNPDLVLMQFYINDIFQNYGYSNKKDKYYVRRKIELFGFLSDIKENLLRNIEPHNSEFLIELIPRNLLSKNYQMGDKREWELTEKILLNIENDIRDINKSFAIVIIPNWGQIYLNYTFAVNKSFLTQYTKNFIKEDMINLIESGDLDKPNKLLKSFGNKYDIVVIDPLLEFRESALKNENLYLLPKDFHLSAKGNQVVAEVIYRELIKNQLVPDKK